VLTGGVHALVRAGAQPARRRLLDVRDPGRLRAVQLEILADTLRRNADTGFGRRYAFAGIRSVGDYRDAVPLSSWDDYAPAVSRILAGEARVLTGERVRLFEPSSGSTAATKLVPYTARLRGEFQQGISAWLADLYATYPRLRSGRSYWSITPAGTPRDPGAGRVPIGFDEDADYLGGIGRRLVSAVLAVPSRVARTDDMDAFLDDTCRYLLAARDLTLISIWHPSLLMILLDRMRERAEDLLASLPARRRAELEGPLRDGDWSALWPDLTVLSCWADAAAAVPARQLAERFPRVVLQPKGLIATEGFVSLPVTAAGGAVFSARSHLVEFLAVDPSRPGAMPGEALLADELEAGRHYAVVLTTGGGLYRYQLGDLVEVTGHHGALPVLRFVGRLDRVSDLVGEKLNEAFVGAVLATLGVPQARLEAAANGYVVWLDSPGGESSPGGNPAVEAGPGTDTAAGAGPGTDTAVGAGPGTDTAAGAGPGTDTADPASRGSDPRLVELARRVDDALRDNPHYDYARRLGQLRPVVAVRRDRESLTTLLDRAGSGRLGDIKPTALVPPRRLRAVPDHSEQSEINGDVPAVERE
jgi:hypothetical protein